MIDTVKKNIYKAFGLNLLSEIILPELPQINKQSDKPDVVITIDDLSELWLEIAGQPNQFLVRDNLVMFQLSNLATFAIRDGNRISVSPMNGADEDEIRLYILGTCMGTILMQRKILPLHGSAVAINGKAYAFVGDSGAGKSTLATAFLSKGYQLLSDDVIAVSLSNDGHVPFVFSAYPQQKLWQETLTAFGMKASQYCSLFERETKYAVPVNSQFSTETLPLAGVFELVKTEREGIDIYPIQRLERLHTLFRHSYRNFLIPRLGLMDWHFSTSTMIIEQIDIFRLRRPTGKFTAHQLVSLVLETLNKEE
ncbi:aldolase [Bacillus paramycoides]|uniref:aldolase n=1 Tax=Bacillus paramycoides TaxID=2026194 RepID=UPI0022439568|nr:aldolase [Bacillus paramycoides]MCW9132437.1 aldolase [Bacillus paramycoides]